MIILFQNYLEAKKLAVRDVLEACIAKMVEGSYSCPGQLISHLSFRPLAHSSAGLKTWAPWRVCFLTIYFAWMQLFWFLYMDM